MNNERNQWNDRSSNYRQDWDDDYNDYKSEWRPTNNRNWNDDDYNQQSRGYHQYTGSGQDYNSYSNRYGRSSYNRGGSNYRNTGSDYGQGSQYRNSGYGSDRYQTGNNYNRYGSRSNYGTSGSYDRGNRYNTGYNQYDNDYDTGSRYGASGSGSRYGTSNYGSRYGSSGYGDQYGSSGVGYNRNYRQDSDYDRRDTDYRRNQYTDNRNDRDFWDKAGDEIASWFGDDDARRRREMDQREGNYDKDRYYAGSSYRGKGPKSYKRSDDRIEEDVNDRLSDDPHLDASDIDVSVSNGEVILSGHVDSRYAKRHAEDLAEMVSGVSNVENRIRVKSTETTQISTTTSDSDTLATTTGTSTGTTAGTTTGTTRTKTSS